MSRRLVTSLFPRLLALHGASKPREDFLTEVVATLFHLDGDLAIRWLEEEVGLRGLEGYEVEDVSTQLAYDPLDGHGRGSRPDMRISLLKDSSRLLVFVEAKVTAGEGEDQLRHYAELLASRPADRRELVYLTRDYDAKDKDQILAQCNGEVGFHQARWHGLYRLLRRREPDRLEEEVLRFMESLKMSNTGQVEPADLVALEQFPRTFALMSETMWGEVAQKFEQVLGYVAQESSSSTQLARHARYVMFTWLKGEWWCGLGYFLPRDPDERARVGVELIVKPTTPARDKIVSAMHAMVEDEATEWEGRELGTPRAWSCIYHTRPLQSFLAHEDHSKAIADYFGKCIEAVDEVHGRFKDLPWRASKEPEDGDTDVP